MDVLYCNVCVVYNIFPFAFQCISSKPEQTIIKRNLRERNEVGHIFMQKLKFVIDSPYTISECTDTPFPAIQDYQKCKKIYTNSDCWC